MKRSIFAIVPALLLLSSFGPTASVNHFNYQVLLDGKPIGHYTVNRTEVNGTAHFRVETTTAAGLIRRSEHRFVMLSSFNDSKLISSDLKTWVDEKLESSSVIHWDGEQYVRQNGEQLSEICSEMFTYSSPCVYFEEPLNRTKLFYEKYGEELPVTALGKHRYEVKLPDGGKERYTYINGKVVEVEFVKSFTTISLKVVS